MHRGEAHKAHRRHQSSTFCAELVPPPTLDGGVDSLPEGGMGLFIMRSFMDRVEFARDQHKNVLTMEKDLVA